MSVILVVLPSLANAVIGVLGLVVAERELRRGSAWWNWVVPGVVGALVIVFGLLRSLGVL
jgi:hypothetical protein